MACTLELGTNTCCITVLYILTGPLPPSHSSTAVPVTDVLPPASQQKQQQQQQQLQLGVQPTVSVARLPARTAAFIPLEDVKGARSSGINIITREQVNLPPMNSSVKGNAKQ